MSIAVSPLSTFVPYYVDTDICSRSMFSGIGPDLTMEDKANPFEEPAPGVSKRRRTQGLGKRASIAEVSLTESFLDTEPEAHTLSVLEVAIATHPKEDILHAIGRSEDLKDRRRSHTLAHNAEHSSTNKSGSIKQDGDSITSYKFIALCEDDNAYIAPEQIDNFYSTKKRRSRVQTVDLKGLRSKFAADVISREIRKQKPIVRLTIPKSRSNEPIAVEPLENTQEIGLQAQIDETDYFGPKGGSAEPVEEPIDGVSAIEEQISVCVSPISPAETSPQTRSLSNGEQVSQHDSDSKPSRSEPFKSMQAAEFEPPSEFCSSTQTNPSQPFEATTNSTTPPDSSSPVKSRPAVRNSESLFALASSSTSGLGVSAMIPRVKTELSSTSDSSSELVLQFDATPQVELGRFSSFFSESESEEEADQGEHDSEHSGGSSATTFDIPRAAEIRQLRRPRGEIQKYTIRDSAAARSFDSSSSSGAKFRKLSFGSRKSSSDSVSAYSGKRAPPPVTRTSPTRRRSSSMARAAHEIREELSCINESLEESHSSTPTPNLPVKSERRFMQQRGMSEMDARPMNFSRPLLARRSTEPRLIPERRPVLEDKRRSTVTDIHDSYRQQPGADQRLSFFVLSMHEDMIHPDAAEAIILQIMGSLHSFDDLFAAARTNRGFYSVYKRNELNLLRRVMFNSSPAVWEFRESSPKEIIAYPEKKPSEYTPLRYCQFHQRDKYILNALKTSILARCQSYLRRETIEALRSTDIAVSAHVDDAFWRIWSFCMLFGSRKDRRDDFTGQLDWLRGGKLAHQTTCSPCVGSGDHFDVNSILTNPPESFGRGNHNGLSAEELYTMSEIWNCLKVLLHGIQGPGRLAQAGENGVFDGIDLEKDDVEGLEAALEEWISHLLSLGLSTIADLTTPSTQKTAAVFHIAQEMGWTKWKPLANGASLNNFFNEAVSYVYEELLEKKRTESPSRNSQEDECKSKERRKIRLAKFAAQLKEKKESKDYSNLPPSDDRPMSMWMEWMNRLEKATVGSPGFSTIDEDEVYQKVVDVKRQTSVHPALRTGLSPSSESLNISPVSTPDLTARFTLFPSNVSSSKRSRAGTSYFRKPSISQFRTRASGSAHAQPMSSSQSQARSNQSSESSVVGESSCDKAMFKIVNLGYTVEDARQALKITDSGVGLSVDRAVQWLTNRNKGRNGT